MGRDTSQLKTTWITKEWLDRDGWTDEELKKNPYMMGVYGYQDGIGSFGIMENGTAFFGRADRGGRIIIDGFNATIYGGANGILLDPTIGDPMWNNMRITFVDLTHSVEEAADVDGVVQGFDGKYFGQSDVYGAASGRRENDFPWWYRFVWEHAWVVREGLEPPNVAVARGRTLTPNDYVRINYWDPTVPQPVFTYGIGNTMRELPYDPNNVPNNPNYTDIVHVKPDYLDYPSPSEAPGFT
jgi:hypothetical protein